jgi:predicted GH43/DUF377 family glycosyl hydrolase
MHVHPRELFRRHDANPVLVAADFPRMVNAVFNPGAVEFGGETLLLVRVEERSGLSHLAVATSADGRTRWTIDPTRLLLPDRGDFAEHWGVEDPRITRIGDEYMIVYTGYSRGGPLVCLAVTDDFVEFHRRGVLMPPEDKDAALFPVRFGDRWALIHRPVPSLGLGAHIWLSWSPDLRHWGDSTVLLPARRGGWWDANKIGIGPPPLLTDHGWLLCYHGVRITAAGSIYRLGLALVDRNDPMKVIARGNEWIFGPHATYERQGDVADVVFPCGWILRDDGDSLDLYYGGADSVVCLATASLADLLDHLSSHQSDNADLDTDPRPLTTPRGALDQG